MVGKLTLTIPIQFSATDHIPGLVSNPGDAVGADAKRKLSIGIFTSITCCARTSDSQAAQKKNANQLYLPLSFHVEIPD